MRKAILIGFQYTDDKKLPGIITDLFLMYNFLKGQGWNDEEIVVFTDIQKDETARNLKKSVIEKLVDASILSFIEDIKDKNQYVQFKIHNHYHNISSLFKEEYKDLLVYYTGHAKEQHLVLPQNAKLSFTNFQKKFKKATTLCIMDCCDGGLSLAFNMIRGVYRSHPDLPLTETKIVCIASTKTSQRAVAGQTGSFFTKNLISILSDTKERNLYTLLSKLEEKNKTQTATVSSSFPNIYEIFGFLYSLPTFDLIIHPKYLLIEYF